jgi:hypothetical protein
MNPSGGVTDTGNTTVDIDKLQKSYGTNWMSCNEDTLHEWISIGSYYIRMIDTASEWNRTFLRYNAIFGIMLSTLTGTISAAQYNNLNSSNLFSIFLTIMSYFVAISGGYMKIYQIQEQLEEYIKIKQEWVDFTTLVVAEMQLPISLRQDAAFLIWKYKAQYIDLLKKDPHISDYIRRTIPNAMIYSGGNFSELKDAGLSDIIQHINVTKNTQERQAQFKAAENKLEEKAAEEAEQKGKGRISFLSRSSSSGKHVAGSPTRG